MYVDENNTWQMSKGENFDFTDHDHFDETLLIKMQFSERGIAELVTDVRRCLFRRLPPSAYLLILRKMYVTHNCLKRDFLPTWTFVFSFILSRCHPTFPK